MIINHLYDKMLMAYHMHLKKVNDLAEYINFMQLKSNPLNCQRISNQSEVVIELHQSISCADLHFLGLYL